MLLIVNFRPNVDYLNFSIPPPVAVSQAPLLLLDAAVLCPRGEAVLLLHCVNERGCQCCYLGDLQGAVSALNSTGPDTVSTAPSAATRLIQSVFGESALAVSPPHTHTHTQTRIFSLSLVRKPTERSSALQLINSVQIVLLT